MPKLIGWLRRNGASLAVRLLLVLVCVGGYFIFGISKRSLFFLIGYWVVYIVGLGVVSYLFSSRKRLV